MPSPAGGSTLITSAPWSASSMPQYGPAAIWQNSMTRTPARLSCVIGSASLRRLRRRGDAGGVLEDERRILLDLAAHARLGTGQPERRDYRAVRCEDRRGDAPHAVAPLTAIHGVAARTNGALLVLDRGNGRVRGLGEGGGTLRHAADLVRRLPREQRLARRRRIRRRATTDL